MLNIDVEAIIQDLEWKSHNLNGTKNQTKLDLSEAPYEHVVILINFNRWVHPEGLPT